MARGAAALAAGFGVTRHNSFVMVDCIIVGNCVSIGCKLVSMRKKQVSSAASLHRPFPI